MISIYDINYLPIRSHWDIFNQMKITLGETPGSIAEFGVYTGASTRHLASIWSDRTIYAFDTFSGMPDSAFDPDLDCNLPGEMKPNLTIEEMFDGYKNIVPVVGLFNDTIWQLPPNIKFIFVFMDCDLYLSYKQVFSWIIQTNRLLENSIIYVDDCYTCKGAVKAVNELLGLGLKLIMPIEKPESFVHPLESKFLPSTKPWLYP